MTKSNRISYNDLISGLQKILPHAIDIEKSVIGCILFSGSSNIINHLKPCYFYNDINKIIFESILSLHSNNDPIDILTVSHQLKKMDKLDHVGGLYYITTLLDTCNVSHVNKYIKILIEKYVLRRLIYISYDTIKRSYDDFEDFLFIINDLKAEIDNLYQHFVFTDTIDHTMQNVVKRTMNDIFLFDAGNIKNYYRTGNQALDNIFMFNTGISVVAGAGGIGKTTFITWYMNSLLNLNEDVSIFWVCIDHETGSSINRKMISSITRLSDSQLQSKNFKLSHDHLDLIIASQDVLQKHDIEFYEKPCSISDIRLRFKSFCNSRSKERMKILLIDNIMRLTDNLSKTNQTAIDDYVANSLANIYNDNRSDDHKVHVIFLHHLTKDVLNESNHSEAYRPTLGMLKGSGRFSDIVETVLLVNRPGHYTKLIDEYPDKKAFLSKLFIVEVAKNTFGKTGMVYFLSDMSTCLFKEIAM